MADPHAALHVRAAVRDDAVALCDVFQAAALHGGQDAYGDAAQAWAQSSTPTGMESEIAHPGKRTWVAEVDDGRRAIVGFATLHRDEVDFCYVAPAAMGQGMGRVLMEHVEQHARQAGIGALDVVASRNAVPFYETLGYEGLARVVRQVGGRDFACLRMRKVL